MYINKVMFNDVHIVVLFLYIWKMFSWAGIFKATDTDPWHIINLVIQSHVQNLLRHLAEVYARGGGGGCGQEVFLGAEVNQRNINLPFFLPGMTWLPSSFTLPQARSH